MTKSHAAGVAAYLTGRQVQTLMLIAEGKTTEEIASALGVSVRTAAAHRASLMQRLGVRRSVDLVRYAIRAESEPAEQHTAQLTGRQTQTLILIAEGKTTKEIASALGVSIKTAAAHRARLMQRLGVHRSVDVVRYAIGAGLVRL